MTILQRVKQRVKRAAMRSVGRSGRYIWQINEVVKAQSVPAAIQRTYLEHRLLREVLAGVGRRFEFAADVGCGNDVDQEQYGGKWVTGRPQGSGRC